MVSLACTYHRNEEGVVTQRVKLCQMQHQDKKSFPNPPLPLKGVSWQLQEFFLGEMSKLTFHFSEDGGRMHLAWERVKNLLVACRNDSVRIPWCWTTVKINFFC